MEKLLTVEEVAQWLNVDIRLLYLWCQKGFIPHYRLGRGLRFSETEIREWLQKRHTTPSEYNPDKVAEQIVREIQSEV